MSGLIVRDVSITLAKTFVSAHHRHNSAPAGAFCAFGVWQNGDLVGVALIGRPVARALHGAAEVTRCCTDGTRNACSKLYAACRRWARARKLVLYTYTRVSETGASLRASGALIDGYTTGGRSWSCPSRPRKDVGTRNEAKIRWRLT